MSTSHPDRSEEQRSTYAPSPRVELEVDILGAETDASPEPPEQEEGPPETKAPPPGSTLAMGLLLVLLGAALWAPHAHAQTYITIDVAIDESDGSCADGDCALRDAIAEVENGATIVFDDALSGATITLGGTEFLLNKSLIIDATGLPGGLTLDADAQSRHFKVEMQNEVTLKGLTLVNGREHEDGRGGAIFNIGGTLTLEDCTLANNSSVDGGAIYNFMGLDFWWDPITGPGGTGDYIPGHLIIRRSTFVGNEATRTGGAIDNRSRMTLVSSTIYDNAADEHGGGIYNDPLNETLDPVSYISHTTISGNTAQGVGGGIAHIATAPELFIDNSTIVENVAYGSYEQYGGGDGMTADAIFTAVPGHNSFSQSVVTVTSSVVSGVAETQAPACYHHPMDAQFGRVVIVLQNSLDASGACNFDDRGDDNVTGDPMLGPLQDNGGPTLTHLPLPGSPLVDAGVCAGGTDQRGYARSVDVPGYANATSACDIGAVEANAEDVTLPELTTYVVDTAEGAYDGDVSAGDRSLREVIALAPTGTTIMFAPSLHGATIDLSGPEITLDKDLTIDGGDLGITLDAAGTHNGGARHFVVTSDAGVTLRGLTLKNGYRPYIFFRVHDSSGGSIFNKGTLSIETCTFEGNYATGSGGAIWNTGTLTIRRSTFTNNSAGKGNENVTGVYEARGDGGAIVNSGTVAIVQSTFSGNTALGFGGALHTEGPTTITASTLVDNAADFEESGEGVGDALYSTTANVTLASSVMAGADSTADCASTAEAFAQNVYSYVADGSCSPLYSGDPLLGPLADNGGLTQTHLPLRGSPLIDATTCEGTDTDQRGEPRPFDHVDAEGAGCDIGAVELQPEDPLPVELAAFEATLDGSTVALQWQTASETNNAGFEVEHREGSESEARWQRIGFVEGRGTTAEAQVYRLRVEALEPGPYVFRLRQLDYDGTSTYGPEVEVTVAVGGTHHLSAAYPNPFHPRTQFTLTVAQAQNVTVAVYDVMGRKVATLFDGEMQAAQKNEVAWKASGHAAGLYYIRIVGNHFVETQGVTLVQ